jgi:lysophospholipase-2
MNILYMIGLHWNADNESDSRPLAGILVLSGYLPNARNVPSVRAAEGKGVSTPILLCHGRADAMVDASQADLTFRELKARHSDDVTLKWYKGMGHSACQEEVDHIAEWLKLRFPEPTLRT